MFNPGKNHGHVFLEQIKLIVALEVKNRIKTNNVINFWEIENLLDSPGPKSRFPVRWE
jgi:hypothetical protein